MKKQDIITLQLLESLSKNPSKTQRDIAKELGISLGLVNAFIKKLVNKGLFKIKTVPKKRMKYILTPKGIYEKTKLTYQYITYALHFYRETRLKIQTIYDEFSMQGKKRVFLVGAGELTEIAFLSLRESNLELAGIVDAEHAGNNIVGTIIGDYSSLQSASASDVVLITKSDSDSDLHRIIQTYVTADNILDIS